MKHERQINGRQYDRAPDYDEDGMVAFSRIVRNSEPHNPDAVYEWCIGGGYRIQIILVVLVSVLICSIGTIIFQPPFIINLLRG